MNQFGAASEVDECLAVNRRTGVDHRIDCSVDVEKETVYVEVGAKRENDSEAGGEVSPWTGLKFKILNEEFRITKQGLNVNDTPYACIQGTLHLVLRGQRYTVTMDDEVRAARGEGSCGLLGIQDIIREAESNLGFRERRQTHIALQGEFQERWEMLSAMADDSEAEGTRVAIYCHALKNRQRLKSTFRQDVSIKDCDHSPMLRFEQMNGFVFAKNDPPCNVRKAAFSFLHPSTHLDERYAKLLLDWLHNKVALIPLTQVRREADGAPLVFHVPEADLISDEAVLFIKMLNVEKQGSARIHLNHFDRVGNHNPIGFLEDLPSVPFPVSVLAPIPKGGDTFSEVTCRL